MTLLVFLAALLVFSVSGRAQGVFRTGYVVGLRGDTLRGRIEHPDWVANPVRINFEDGRTGKTVSYAAAELAAFSVNDEVYRSYRVTIYPYSQDPAVVTAPGWSGQSYDTAVFLRLVTGGTLSLYCFRDEGDVIYFFLQKGGTGQLPQELKIQNRIVRHNATSNVITDNVYKYQLSDYVSACSAIADRPVQVAYEENALKALIDTYNHCGVKTGEKGRRRVLVNILPMAGYLHSDVHFSGNADAAHAIWPVYNGPVGGLGILLRPAKGSKAAKRWGILVDFLYDQYMMNSHRFQKSYYLAWYGKMAYSEAKGDIQVRYGVPIGNFEPFLSIGFSNSLIFNNTSSQKIIDLNDNSTIRQPLFGDNSYMNTYRPGAFGVVGLGWKHWSIEGRYERTANLVSTAAGVSSPVTNIYVLVGFRL